MSHHPCAQRRHLCPLSLAVPGRVLRYLFSPHVPIVWLRRHTPNELLEWWPADVPLIRDKASKSIRIRNLIFDVEMPTSDFLTHVSELNEYGIEAYQLSRAVPNTLTLNGLEWGPDKRRQVLIQNGCVAGFYLPHADEVAQFRAPDRATIESALAHEPVVQTALQQP